MIAFVRRICFFILFIFSLSLVFSAENMAYVSPYEQNFAQYSLSSLAEVSLITFDSSTPFYRTFGHSSIRVSDPVKNIDKLFTFAAIEDIDSPPVLFSLLYSKPLAKAGAARFNDVIAYDLKNQNRLVIEQQLNISREDKEKIYSYLLWKTQESNRSDNYELTKNNCATQCRDVIKLALATGLPENAFLYRDSSPLTYRFLIKSKLSPWASFAADFVLGSVADRKSELYDMTFMPDILRSVVSISKIKNQKGETVSLIKNTSIISTPTQAKNSISQNKDAPELFFFLFAAFAMCATILQPSLYLLSHKNEKTLMAYRIASSLMQAFDILFFFITGSLGLFILFLNFFGKNAITAGNINFLWLLPTNIIFAFSCYKEKNSPIISGYFLSLVYLSLFILIFREKLFQYINPAFTPIILITIFRAFYQAVSRPLKAMLPMNVSNRNKSAQNRQYTKGLQFQR